MVGPYSFRKTVYAVEGVLRDLNDLYGTQGVVGPQNSNKKRATNREVYLS